MKNSLVTNIQTFKAHLVLVLVCLITLASFKTSYASTIIKKRVQVEVISGTYAGKKGNAVFSYDSSKSTHADEETLEGIKIVFNFLGQKVTGKPHIILNKGKFKDVAWVASIKDPEGYSFNFGLNSGFSRCQFQRPTEAFARKSGESYFAYFFPNTRVDGVGTLKYDRAPL